MTRTTKRSPLSLLPFLAFLFVLIFNLLLLSHFHNRSWLPEDEGQYAHVAERILDGEILNAQIQEHHPGYINFINALALRLFGRDLVSLRYPLVVLATLQSLLLFFVFLSRGLWTALLAALTSTCLGFILFPNPTPNWYCLFFGILIACCLLEFRRGFPFRLEIIGFFVGVVFLLRQLSGLFIGMGVLAFLLVEESRPTVPQKKLFLARLLLVSLFGAILLYPIQAAGLLAFLLFGLWPLLLLGWAWFRVGRSNEEVLKILVRLALGAFLAFLPLFAYHLVHHSLLSWFGDTVLRPLKTPILWRAKIYPTFFKYSFYFIGGGYDLIVHENISSVLNGFYWLALPLLASVNGLFLLSHLRSLGSDKPLEAAIPFLAVFYSLVSPFNPNVLYLWLTVGFSLSGILWLVAKSPKPRLIFWSAATLFLCFTSVFYQAGQILAGGRLKDFIAGKKTVLVPSTLKRLGLWMSPTQLRTYTRLIQRIQKETHAGESIFVLPINPELYFLAERRNPFRFWDILYGLQSKKEVEDAIRELAQRPPKLVIYRSSVYRSQRLFRPLILHIRKNYHLIEKIGDFQVYRSALPAPFRSRARH